jgi:hypothetical protein
MSNGKQSNIVIDFFIKKDLIIEVAKDVPRHAAPDHGTRDTCPSWPVGADAPRHEYVKE